MAIYAIRKTKYGQLVLLDNCGASIEANFLVNSMHVFILGETAVYHTTFYSTAIFIGTNSIFSADWYRIWASSLI